ncbi:hypothetical protein [Reichenbachiella sp.]
MKILVAAALSIILFSSAFSQDKRFANEDETWLDGYAYLSSGEKVKGKISYHYVTETIKIKRGSTLKTYPARKISRFTVVVGTGEKKEYFVFRELNEFLLLQYKNNKAAIFNNFDYVQKNESLSYADANGNTQSASRSTEALLKRIYLVDKNAEPYRIMEAKIERKSGYGKN